jgi:hypothetical protein
VTAAAVLEVARRELGTVESPHGSNRTKYGQAYGWNGVAWCAIFCWYVFGRAGVAPLIPKSASTVVMRDWYRARGQWHTSNPQPGDLVFFKFPGNNNPVNHIGIVEGVEPGGTLVVIEGNTAGTASGDQRNGGMVARKRRMSNIVGFARPAYTRAPAAAPTPTATRPGGPELDATERRMLTEIHAQLNAAFPSRVDHALLGQTPPAAPYRDTAPGYTINADARAYEARELIRAARTEIAALTRLVESQQAAIEAVARMAGQGGGVTAQEIKDAVSTAIRDNVIRVDIAGVPAGRS